MPGIPPTSPVAPWHMWGSSKTITLVQGAAGSATAQTLQLGRVNYRRPETWSFFMAARLVDGTTNAGPANEDLEVNFQIIVGVGRSVLRTQEQGQNGWVRMLWSIPPAVHPGGNLNNLKYTTVANSVPLQDGVATSTEKLEWIVAQDIQCYAQVAFLRVPPGNSVTVEVTSFFAPRVHVRPDWFTEAGEDIEVNEAAKYLGTERGGT